MITVYPKCPSCKKPNATYTSDNNHWTCTQCSGCKTFYSWHMMTYKGKVVVYNIVVGFGLDDAG